MIEKALSVIKNMLQNGMDFQNTNDKVFLGNISMLDANSNGINPDQVDYRKQIVLSLLRIEEEKTLKNLPGYEIVNQKTIYKNPPVFLNLYLLFTVGTNNTSDYYKTVFSYLSQIIKYFQANHEFTEKDSWQAPEESDENGEVDRFHLIMDLYSPSFEEANYMWSTLGGRQLPHVCYKMRLIELEKETKQEERGVVKEITLID